ncbi:hypothetical protein HS088_TW02G00524 [Tripterygium wilfordii]|uniref:Uncharacterized protein n=1 Tax=Tripterygium wilfordii TaxID=458696 RepID=A0A7J7DYP4_TRIWF|nr:hypothetical protein HS088_TW02G00524 [Tripterygium wilfordii]
MHLNFMLQLSPSGQRYIKVTKCPISPPLDFPFNITSSGISLPSDKGTQLTGQEIYTISGQGLLLVLLCLVNMQNQYFVGIQGTSGIDLTASYELLLLFCYELIYLRVWLTLDFWVWSLNSYVSIISMKWFQDIMTF